MPDGQIRLTRAMALKAYYTVHSLIQMKEYFASTSVMEIREYFFEKLTTQPPNDVGIGWIQDVTQGLGEIGETKYQEKLLEWYLMKCHDWERPAAFRFLLQLSKISAATRGKLVNYLLKLHPELYWTTDALHEEYLRHFRRFTDGSIWIPASLEQWKTAERYVRRIVAAQDASYYELFRDWAKGYRDIPIVFREPSDERPGNFPDFLDAGRFGAFLRDTAAALKCLHKEQKLRIDFGKVLLDATAVGKDSKLRKSIEIDIHYPNTSEIADAVKQGKRIEAKIIVRGVLAVDKSGIDKYLSRVEVGLDVDGAESVHTWNRHGLIGNPLASFDVEKRTLEFSFKPLSNRQRIKFKFFLDMQEKGACVKYFQTRV